MEAASVAWFLGGIIVGGVCFFLVGMIVDIRDRDGSDDESAPMAGMEKDK